MTAPANCPTCRAAAAADPALASIEATDGEAAATFAINAAYVDVHYAEHVEQAPRSRRVLMCRRCGQDTGIPGAYYCDTCRPLRLSDHLLSDVDLERLTP